MYDHDLFPSPAPDFSDPLGLPMACQPLNNELKVIGTSLGQRRGIKLPGQY